MRDGRRGDLGSRQAPDSGEEDELAHGSQGDAHGCRWHRSLRSQTRQSAPAGRRNQPPL